LLIGRKQRSRTTGLGAALGAGLPTTGGAGRSKREAPPIVLLLITDPLRTEPLKLEEEEEEEGEEGEEGEELRCKRERARGGAPWAETSAILPTAAAVRNAIDNNALTFRVFADFSG
jgi:hypothetical protein